VLAYERDDAAQSTTARFGHIVDGGKLRVAMPAFAPTPRMRYEARAVLSLIKGGAEVPVVIVPLSTRRDITGELAPALPDPKQRRLIEEETPVPPRLVIPDVESEAFAFWCDARGRFTDDSVRPPKAVKELLRSGLSANPKKGRKETGDAWSFVEAQYGLSTVGSWIERLQTQARSLIFLSPSPVVRSLPGSAARAFDYGWRITDSIQETAFQGRGIQLLLASDVFLDNAAADAERRALVDNFRALHQSRNPRNNPHIAIKFLDPHHRLTQGPQRSVARGHVKDLLCQAAEHVRLANGLFIVHNVGTWVLPALDCGVDIVGSRGTGDLLGIDSNFGVKKPKGRKTVPSSVRSRTPTRPFRKIRINPFDPIRLCDAAVKDVAIFWKEHESAAVAEHVEPMEWAKLDVNQKREYRAMQVFGSLLEIARQFRGGRNSDIPLRDSIRDRVARMKNQDEMFDLCPSLEGSG
jgi:hypothetical protein